MNFKSSKGLTIAELVISLAILVVLGLVSSLYLINVRRNRALYADAYAILAVLRDAQQRAITQDSIVPDEHWGVHFYSTSTTTPFYELFTSPKGIGYPGQQYSRLILKSWVTFCNPTYGLAKDLHFENITGLPTDKSGLANETYVNVKLKDNPREYVEIRIDKQGSIVFTDRQDC